jgi:chromate transport protein ChrA
MKAKCKASPGAGVSAVLQDELVHKRRAIGRGEFMVNLTLMPAALALVVVSSFRLGREFFTPSLELGLVLGAGAGVLLLGLNPSLMLLAGGLIGAIALRQPTVEEKE